MGHVHYAVLSGERMPPGRAEREVKFRTKKIQRNALSLSPKSPNRWTSTSFSFFDFEKEHRLSGPIRLLLSSSAKRLLNVARAPSVIFRTYNFSKKQPPPRNLSFCSLARKTDTKRSKRFQRISSMSKVESRVCRMLTKCRPNAFHRFSENNGGETRTNEKKTTRCRHNYSVVYTVQV